MNEEDMILEDSRINLLGNRIALITALDCKTVISLEKGANLSDILGEDKLAMGDPDHVPAGIYGKQALTSLGIWPEIAPKTARTKDVRAALALVERGEAKFGLVYTTDAAISDKVKVAAKRYQTKLRRKPTVCYINPNETELESFSVGTIVVKPALNILPHHFWVGIE